MSNTGYFQYNMRAVVHSGFGSAIRVPALLQGLGARRVLLISDAGLKAVGVVDRVAATFDTWQSGTMPTLAGIYTDISPDAGLDESLAKSRDGKLDEAMKLLSAAARIAAAGCGRGNP